MGRVRALSAALMLCHVPWLGAAHAYGAEREHIRRIESELQPAVRVKGQSARTKSLATLMRELAVPAVAMAFIQHGRLVWTQAIGLRSVGGLAINDGTVFQAASISKCVTAMAVILLYQRGTLDLDRSVDAYLRSWQVPSTDAAQASAVTLRRVLSHTAGLSVHGFEGYEADAAIPTLQQILNGAPPANSPAVRLQSPPGTLWAYSGGGYVLVQQLLTDRLARPFPELMEQLLLKPLEMQRSSFEQPLAARLQDNAAMPHDARGVQLRGGPHTYPEESAAGLWTTASDLARLVINIQQSLAGQPQGLLSAPVARVMLMPVSPGSWALGFRVGGKPGARYFMHGGSNAGFRCLLVAFESGDGMVVMTNGDAGAALAAALVRTAAVEYAWPEFQPKRFASMRLRTAELDRLAGIYRLSPDVTVTVRRIGQRLQIQIGDDEPLLFDADGPVHFLSLSDGSDATFRGDARSPAAGLRLDTLLVTYNGIRESEPHRP